MISVVFPAPPSCPLPWKRARTSLSFPWLSSATARLFTAAKFSGSAARTCRSSVSARTQSPSAEANSAAFIASCIGSAVGSSATAARCFAAIATYPPWRYTRATAERSAGDVTPSFCTQSGSSRRAAAVKSYSLRRAFAATC